MEISQKYRCPVIVSNGIKLALKSAYEVRLMLELVDIVIFLRFTVRGIMVRAGTQAGFEDI